MAESAYKEHIFDKNLMVSDTNIMVTISNESIMIRAFHIIMVVRVNSTVAEEVARFNHLFPNLSWLKTYKSTTISTVKYKFKQR